MQLTEATPPAVELDELIALFYREPSGLGRFAQCSFKDCPAIYSALLDHDEHMTVTVERRHASSVDVQVLESRMNSSHYLRKIVLRRKSDRRVVLFGIVRLALAALQPVVRDEIMAQKIPLGRVLILHNVLRHVQLNALWRVVCGRELAELFETQPETITYGRTAMIFCDGEPAVELLEIVSPEESN